MGICVDVDSANWGSVGFTGLYGRFMSGSGWGLVARDLRI
jgi:hypothetical protein